MNFQLFMMSFLVLLMADHGTSVFYSDDDDKPTEHNPPFAGKCNDECNEGYVCVSVCRDKSPNCRKCAPIGSGKCPVGWTLFKSKCYKYIDTLASWVDANKLCETFIDSWGISVGRLAVLDDYELLFVFGAIRQNAWKTSLAGYYYPWVYNNDRGAEDVYTYPNGSALPDSLGIFYFDKSEANDCSYVVTDGLIFAECENEWPFLCEQSVL